MNEWLNAISTVGFPIVCCVFLFYELNKLKDVIAANNEAIAKLTEIIKMLDRRAE